MTVPAGGPPRAGTLAAILAEVASHFEITRGEGARQLFGE